jgi:HSP20 family protein
MANHLTRFNPFGDLARFDAFRDFEDVFRNFRLAGPLAESSASRITLDVTENDKAYVVAAEVPGAKKEDVKVSVEGNTVSIRVETRRDNEEKQGEAVLRRERYYGVQSRAFSLPHDIDDAGATAKYADGVLELTLPKRSGRDGAKVLEIQ